MKTLTHITDVGSPAHDGTDSSERIRRQYLRLGVEPRVVSAGQSPLHVAFTACTDVSSQARENVKKVLELFGISKSALLPTALNSAPRNATESQADGQEDYIYRVSFGNKIDETFLIYGPEVLRWVLTFRGRVGAVVEKITGIHDLIPNTSNGSQFRSAEHLPLVHFLEVQGKLNEVSERQPVELNEIPDISPDEDNIVVIPPDEYGNGRILVRRDTFNEVLGKDSIKIPGISSRSIAVKKSLTEVVPDTLSVWPSSNHFTDETLGVLNIGTRWRGGSTRTTNGEVIELSRRFSNQVGESHRVET